MSNTARALCPGGNGPVSVGKSWWSYHSPLICDCRRERDSIIGLTESLNSDIEPKDNLNILNLWTSTCIIRLITVESRAQLEEMIRALESLRIKLIVGEEELKLKNYTDTNQRMSEQRHSGKHNRRI